MIRKTNLFYTEGNESNFLTFSNYAEHMTGVYLTTDQKLFPSKFLCIYSKELDEAANERDKSFDEAKTEFITKYLVGYYENKLAFLRDHLLNNNILPDSKLEYLNYLLMAINEFDNTALKNIHIGEISEQDYNGTFTDIICTIESNETQKGKLVYDFNKDTYQIVDYTSSRDHLYGWYNTVTETMEDGSLQVVEKPNCPEIYNDVTPVFDDGNTNQYKIDTNIKNISLESSNYDIKFNIVIPLYDCIDVNYMTNDTIIIENAPIELGVNNENIVTMVPYGIWFSQYPIELKRDPETKFGQAWSLLIGTQFKPFPNSKFLASDEFKSDTEKSFASFAYVLSQQNNLVDDLTKYNVLCGQLKNKISLLEQQMNNIVDVNKINTLTQKVEEIWDLINSDTSTIIKISNKNKWLVK